MKRCQLPFRLRHVGLTDPTFEEGFMRDPTALPGIVRAGEGLGRSLMRHVGGMVAVSQAWTIAAVAALVLGAGLVGTGLAQSSPQPHQVPSFQVDPAWPKKLPANWELGSLSGIDVDADDHVWVIQRPPSKPDAGMIPAPPVLEYDAAGNLIQSWGGPGPNYEWPGSEHGIYVDYKGFVWVSGSGTDLAAGNDQILKFTKTGKFVMQIGHKGKSTGNADKENMNGPADMSVYPKTNEIFVADGYFNRRVIVFDAETGAFKRMWGAFGNVPTDPPPSEEKKGGVRLYPDPKEDVGVGAQQFDNLHGIKVSNDGLVYVADKGNRRIQIFTVEGKYVDQVFVNRGKLPESTLTGMVYGKSRKALADESAKDSFSANWVAFSPDSAQRFMYVPDRRTQTVLIYDRKTLGYLGSFGVPYGVAPGEFLGLHSLATDSKGNIYTTEGESYPAKRVQKFLLKGLTSAM